MKKILMLAFLSVSIVSIVAMTGSAPAFVDHGDCVACHNQLSSLQGEDISIGSDWSGSMMANAARDPYWQAAIRRETMRLPAASRAIQNECSACHMPMTRYRSKVAGQLGEVFAHFPIVPNDAVNHQLAVDGVSCAMCHQILADKLGTPESFTAGFVLDNVKPYGEREIYGPYDVEAGHQRLMHSASLFTPRKASHIQSSEFCASCHTLYTHALNEKGEDLGRLPEQVPYLEWKHSGYADAKSCQSCHMPEVDGEAAITGVMGVPREKVSRHVFRGGNILVPRMLNQNRGDLGVNALPQSLQATADRSTRHLETSAARVHILSAESGEGSLSVEVEVRNLAGHKLPTAYPSRRVWIHFTALDADGKVVFESGRLQPDGAIAGNDNDARADRFEPHYKEITRQDQVQIYEPIMGDVNGKVTTMLLSGVQYLKDNRVLPMGFDKATAPKDCAVYGAAIEDQDFKGHSDRITYRIPLTSETGMLRLEVELRYQPIGYRWAHNFKDTDAMETRRFVKYFKKFAPSSAVVLARGGVCWRKQ